MAVPQRRPLRPGYIRKPCPNCHAVVEVKDRPGGVTLTHCPGCKHLVGWGAFNEKARRAHGR